MSFFEYEAWVDNGFESSNIQIARKMKVKIPFFGTLQGVLMKLQELVGTLGHLRHFIQPQPLTIGPIPPRESIWMCFFRVFGEDFI